MKLSRALGLLLALAAAGCARPAKPSGAPDLVLRIAVSSGRMSVSSPDGGLAQIKNNISIEPLATLADDGIPRPAVAEGWTVSDDRRVVTVRLRPNVLYQDGTPLTAADVAGMLVRRLPREMGPAYEDIETVRAVSSRDLELRFRRPSGFRIELLEMPIQKPGQIGVGTGPYIDVPGAKNQMRGNPHYYLGKPVIDSITIESYPTFRSAWADMLRDRNDMLYDVGVDALDSLTKAKGTAHVFAFPRRYQYLLMLNTKLPALRSPVVRQALNAAIDRQALIRDALNGFGDPSIGPVSARNWAMTNLDVPKIVSNPTQAAALMKTVSRPPIRFTCLVIPDFERIALVLKRQLSAVGVDMALESVAPDQLFRRMTGREFDAFLVDGVSGPTLYRLYRFWHSGETLNPLAFGTPGMDVALDEIRHSTTDDEYRAGVSAFVKATIDDPPAVFLAWSQGARAVSGRFEVPADPGRTDPLSTLRLWRPANAQAASRRN